MRITQDQVLKFEKILLKRIADIEEVIDSHFEMIKLNIRDRVKATFVAEARKREKDGVCLSLREQINLEKSERKAM